MERGLGSNHLSWYENLIDKIILKSSIVAKRIKGINSGVSNVTSKTQNVGQGVKMQCY